MTIFTRYMVGRFTKPFAFGLGLFAVLIFVGDTFDKMNQIMRSHAPLITILECLWLGVPYWAVRIIPMATLLATLVAISGFVQSGEWLATQACGLKTRDFWIPVLACAFLVSLIAFAAQETVMPAAWARSRRLWREKVHPEWEWTKYQNVAMLGGPNQFIQAWLFLAKEGKFERPTLDVFSERGVERQLDAKYALWDQSAGRWVFYEGVERVFGSLGAVETPFATKVSDLTAGPMELIPRALSADEMTIRESFDYSRRVGRFGGSPREYEVAAQAKIAYPFTNFVICALGIPIALRLRKSSRVVSFVTALTISFIYLWTMEVGKALGAGASIPAWLAAWLPNLCFAALAAGLLKRWDL